MQDFFWGGGGAEKCCKYHKTSRNGQKTIFGKKISWWKKIFFTQFKSCSKWPKHPEMQHILTQFCHRSPLLFLNTGQLGITTEGRKDVLKASEIQTIPPGGPDKTTKHKRPSPERRQQKTNLLMQVGIEADQVKIALQAVGYLFNQKAFGASSLQHKKHPQKTGELQRLASDPIRKKGKWILWASMHVSLFFT